MDNWITPDSLIAGDTVAIVSPAGCVNTQFVEDAATVLQTYGYKVRVMPHALGRHGTFSGTVSERLSDFTEAWLDSDVKAVLCSRGGYGAVALLQALDVLPLEQCAKWLMGFSDISALHALMAKHHVHSIHGPMAKYIREAGVNRDYALDILAGQRKALAWRSEVPNTPGKVSGRIVGGNMAVLSALMGTPYDIYRRGDILVIEDINEPIYKVERMLWQLRLSGVLAGIKGVIVGDFCDWQPDRNYATMHDMIKEFFRAEDMPLAFGAPIGHDGRCLPWIEGGLVTLDVGIHEASMDYV